MKKCILCDKKIKEIQDWKLGVYTLTHTRRFYEKAKNT